MGNNGITECAHIGNNVDFGYDVVIIWSIKITDDAIIGATVEAYFSPGRCCWYSGTYCGEIVNVFLNNHSCF